MPHFEETHSEWNFFDEVESPHSKDELESIILSVTHQNPAADKLFKGKYQVLLLENLLPQQKPLGEYFQTTVAICGAKPKHFSSSNDPEESDLSTLEADDGMPMSVVFDSLIEQEKASSNEVMKKIKEKVILYPLSEAVMRKILRICTTINRKQPMQFPIIAIGHDQDPKSILILGCHRIKNKVFSLRVTNPGSITERMQLPKYSLLKLSHLSGFAPKHTSIQSSVFARFHVLRGETDPDFPASKHMNVEVDCFWNEAKTLLEPPTADAACFAKVKAVEGDENTGACKKFKELKIIMNLHASLETGRMEWSTSKGDIMDKLNTFINGEKNVFSKKGRNPPTINTNFENFERVASNERSNLDFTDKLWLILKDCSSCDELNDALCYVYNKLNEFLVPPFVYGKNISTISKAIKSMRENSGICSMPNNHHAVEMLLEIGVEKLRKDYSTIFCGLELAPSDFLSPYLQSDLLSSEAVTSLRKLHEVLELSLICHKFLHLPKISLSDFIRNSLKYYSSVAEIDFQHIFRFQIPPGVVLHLLAQMRPTIWELSLVSIDSSSYTKQTIHQFSMTPTPEHVLAPKGHDPLLLHEGAAYMFLKSIFIQHNIL